MLPGPWYCTQCPCCVPVADKQEGDTRLFILYHQSQGVPPLCCQQTHSRHTPPGDGGPFCVHTRQFFLANRQLWVPGAGICEGVCVPKRHPKPPNRTPPTESVHLLEKQLVYPTDTTLRRRRRTKEDCRIDNEMKVYKIFKKRRMCVSPPPQAPGPTLKVRLGGQPLRPWGGGQICKSRSACAK